MTDFKIKPNLWAETVADQDMWRATMKKGEAKFERAPITRMEDNQQ
jgi:hypothetical protein